MKVFDKASWHIDAGEDKKAVIERLELIYSYLKRNDMLTDEGTEIYELGMDSSTSINEKCVNSKGAKFLDDNINKILEMKNDEIKGLLK